MREKLKVYEEYVDLFAGEGYNEGVNWLAQCKDTGNGYIFYFPSYVCTEQDNYICMDYAEAAYIYKILKHYKKQGAFDE